MLGNLCVKCILWVQKLSKVVMTRLNALKIRPKFKEWKLKCVNLVTTNGEFWHLGRGTTTFIAARLKVLVCWQSWSNIFPSYLKPVNLKYTSLVIRFKLFFVIDCPVGFNPLVAGCLYMSKYHLRPREAIKLHFTVPSVLQLISLEWNRNNLENWVKLNFCFFTFSPLQSPHAL